MTDSDRPAATPDPDELQRRLERARVLLDEGGKAIAEGRRLLRAILPAVTNPRARGVINRRLWQAERLAGQRQHFFSQAGQDAWLDERVFRGRRGGTFGEIGGCDGITGSNCLFFELMRGWSGLLVAARSRRPDASIRPSPAPFLPLPPRAPAAGARRGVVGGGRRPRGARGGQAGRNRLSASRSAAAAGVTP